MTPITLTVPCPDEATARGIAEEGVAARRAACANIWGPVLSVFRWEGAVEEAREWMLSFKTTEAQAAPLAELVRRLHPYDLPAITWERNAADKPTREWLSETVGVD